MILPLQERKRLASVVRAFRLGAVIVDKRWGENWITYGRNPSDSINIGKPPEQPEVTH